MPAMKDLPRGKTLDLFADEWRRTARASPPRSSGARSTRERTSRRRGARPPPRSVAGWTSAASTGARPSSSCPSSAHRPPAPDPGGGRWLDAARRDGPDARRKPRPAARRGRRCADALAADRPVDRLQAARSASAGLPSGPDATAAASTRPSAGWSRRCTSCSSDGDRSRPPSRAAAWARARTRPAARRAPGARPRRHRRPLGRAGAAAAHRSRCSAFARRRGSRSRRAVPTRWSRSLLARSHRADPHPRPRSARRRAVRLAGIAALAGPRCLPRLRGRGAVGRGPGAGGARLRGAAPVALVAHDRLLVRRVHALLVRSGAHVVDETGWRLSTTRAAAGFMALLHSARHDAGNDALLDWLKSGTRWGRHDRHAIAALEARVRRAEVSRVAGLATVPLHDAAAERLRDDAVAVLRPLQRLGSAPLAEWLAATLEALRRQRRPVAPGRRRGRHGPAAGAAARSRARRARRAPGCADRSFAEPGRVHALVSTRSSSRPPSARNRPLAGCDGRRRRCPRHAARASDAAALRRRRAARLRRRASAPGPCPKACCRARPPRWPASPRRRSGSGESGSPSPSCCASRR